MLTILTILILQDIPPSDFLNRAADQLFSLGLLLIVAWVLWRRLNAVEDRLNHYLKEDREKMLEVIQDNTEAYKGLTERISRL